MRVLITGAAGNLGLLLAQYLLESDSLFLNLLIHRKNLPKTIQKNSRVTVFKGDLAHQESLLPAMENADCVIHFAGILFKNNPEKFLPTTNTEYFKNLSEAAVKQKVKRMILISFPHVEGESFPDRPASGRLDGNPESAHARTRLEEEKFLFSHVKNAGIEAISLRVGMVYGKGILMVDAARYLAERNFLAVWKKPTWIHLISREDFLEATKQAIIKPHIQGIYHLGDEGKQTLQEFLDLAAVAWGCRRPWRLPVFMIQLAAFCCEFQSRVFGTTSPLTLDFIKIGMCSYYGDTSRMRVELLPTLRYKTLNDGKGTLVS